MLRSQNSVSTATYIPAMGQFLSVRPKLIKEEEYGITRRFIEEDLRMNIFSFKIERERKLLVPPPFNVASLKEYVMSSLTDAIEKGSSHLRDPVGGSYSNWLV